MLSYANSKLQLRLSHKKIHKKSGNDHTYGLVVNSLYFKAGRSHKAVSLASFQLVTLEMVSIIAPRNFNNPRSDQKHAN